MRGLIYKEVSVFYKCIDKKMIFVSGWFVLLLLYRAGAYGGMMASVLLAIMIGAQNIMSFISDDKARWGRYQMAMPVSSFSVVASKYLAVICTIGFGIVGSIVLNLVCGVFSQSFDLSVLGLSIFLVVWIPLIWTGICLPCTYWFGVQSAQMMGLLFIIPLFYAVKYFEDGIGLPMLTDFLAPYCLIAGIAAALLFGFSLAVSVAGYARRK